MRNEEASRLKGTASPYNKRIEQSARGRHGFRGFSVLASPWANALPVPSSPSASQAGLRPCSQFIRALYGRKKIKGRKNGMEEIGTCNDFSDGYFMRYF
jgi:hypothetical protein